MTTIERPRILSGGDVAWVVCIHTQLPVAAESRATTSEGSPLSTTGEQPGLDSEKLPAVACVWKETKTSLPVKATAVARSPKTWEEPPPSVTHWATPSL